MRLFNGVVLIGGGENALGYVVFTRESLGNAQQPACTFFCS